MEYHIKFKTPGTVLSSDSLFAVLAVFRKDFERGIIDAIIQEFPQVSKRRVVKQVKGNISFNFQEVNRGSWIIDMDGAFVLLIGRVLFELGKDIVLKHPEWENFKALVYRVTSRAAINTKEQIQKHDDIGPFDVDQNKAQIQDQTNGVPKLNIDIELSRKNNNSPISTVKEQEDALRDELNRRKDNEQ